MIRILIIFSLCFCIMKAENLLLEINNTYNVNDKYIIEEKEMIYLKEKKENNFIFNFLIDFKYKDFKTESILSSFLKEINKETLKEDKKVEIYNYNKFDIIGFYLEIGYKF